MTQRARRWYEYEKQAQNTTLQMLQSVPADRQTEPAFETAAAKFAHGLLARQLWLHRMGKAEHRPQNIFPQEVRFEDLPQLLDETYSAWDAYMSELDDDEISRSFDYLATEGIRFANRVEDILTHLHGHALYHRGQVALLVNQCGGEVVDTDFVFSARKQVSGVTPESK